MTRPRYIIHDGVWYVRRDHVAGQLKVAIESAFADGLRFTGQPPPRKRSKRGPNHLHKTQRATVVVA